MRYFSTFTGIGGFEIGIQNAYRSTNRGGESGSSQFSDDARQRLQPSKGEGVSTANRQPGTDTADSIDDGPLCVGYSEIDRAAISVFERHTKGIKNYGDITKIDADNLPYFDCLVGGFPCQSFSIAGKRRGFEDTRGTLFFDIARILKAKRPRLLVLENVKGLLSHDNGGTFKTIVSALTELGYDLQWQVLNSKDFGVPQNRERIIIVGHLRGTPRPEVFPIWRESSAHLEEITSQVSDAQRIYKPTLAQSQKALGGGLGAKTGLYEVKDAQVRRLTPLECERLQGFPDNWTAYDMMGLPNSDTQRYKMCGNAVTTNVIQAVFERIFESVHA